MSFQELLQKAREVGRVKEGEINFYYTSDDFPAVSVTGGRCALDCDHCKGIMIQRLPSVAKAGSLLEFGEKIKGKANGMLLTGGCDRRGRVPLEKHLPVIRKLKENTDLKIIAHTGILDQKEADAIAETGIDGVCVDVVGSEKTAERVYGVKRYPKEYETTLKALRNAGIKIIAPHVCVGLEYGKLSSEEKALEIIEKSGAEPENVVIVGLVNLRDTPMENVKVKARDIIKVTCKARIMFPESLISLGCARGTGSTRAKVDELGIKAGVDNIAIPTPRAYEIAEKEDLNVNEFGSCCGLPPGVLSEK